jgi:hypothetical protein
MKKIIIVIAIVFLSSATGVYAAPTGTPGVDTQSYTAIVPSMSAIAEWVADFKETYDEHGIYQAVAEVFDDGRTPHEITTDAFVAVKDINPQNLVAALYCAGAKHEDIRLASEDAGFSEMILVSGFETAKTVCGDENLDTQAFTPNKSDFASVPGAEVSGRTFGSSSDFTGATN